MKFDAYYTIIEGSLVNDLASRVVHDEVWIDHMMRMRDIHAALHDNAYLRLVDDRHRQEAHVTWSDVFSSVRLVR